MGTAKLWLGIDYGTATLGVAYRIVRPDQKTSASKIPLEEIVDVHFAEHDHIAPQEAAWTESGKFYWGHQIVPALLEKRIKPEQVITLWKLLLYKNHQSSPEAQETKKKLGARTLLELVTAHLIGIIDFTKSYVQKQETMNAEYTTIEIAAMPIEVLISVPQMWTAPANRIMTSAAKQAGVHYVELVYEPQCAAAYFTHHIKGLIPKDLDTGDVLLIADVGGGTGDFVSYQYKTSCDTGAAVELQTVGTPQGALCGSVFVNFAFSECLKGQGDWKKRCKDLGLTYTAAQRQANIAFEAVKEKFQHVSQRFAVPIVGEDGAKLDSWTVRLTGTQVASFFDFSLKGVMKCIDAQLTPNTKVMIIPGGFGRSQWVLDRLNECYGDRLKVLGQATKAVGSYQPVSRGALFRYHDINARGLPSTEAFGIGQVEVFKEELHPDAMYEPGQVMSSGRKAWRRTVNHTIAQPDPYNSAISVVYERWLPIMEKGLLKTPGQRFTTKRWQLHTVIPGQKTISVQVYWTQSDIAEHDPILDGPDMETGNVKDGIENWGEPLVKQLPNLAKSGFPPKRSDAGDVYEILSRLVLTCDGANVDIQWELARPGTRPYKMLEGDDVDQEWQEDGDMMMDLDCAEKDLFRPEVFVLADAAFNPSVRTEVK